MGGKQTWRATLCSDPTLTLPMLMVRVGRLFVWYTCSQYLRHGTVLACICDCVLPSLQFSSLPTMETIPGLQLLACPLCHFLTPSPRQPCLPISLPNADSAWQMVDGVHGQNSLRSTVENRFSLRGQLQFLLFRHDQWALLHCCSLHHLDQISTGSQALRSWAHDMR